MKLNNILHTIVLTLLVLYSTLSLASVEITIAEKTVKYDSPPRLVDVLEPIALEKEWYWAGASIFKFESNEIQGIRTQAISKLSALKQEKVNNKSDYQNIIEQLNSWQIATRVVNEIDYDLARIRLDKNPAFENGKYFVSLTTRPQKIYINGAVKEPLVLEVKENSCVTDYIKQIALLDIASKDFVHIIQPNGIVKKVGIAYWNGRCVMAMPNSQIYVPLAENPMFSDTIKLNKLIVKLSSNRILIQ